MNFICVSGNVTFKCHTPKIHTDEKLLTVSFSSYVVTDNCKLWLNSNFPKFRHDF